MVSHSFRSGKKPNFNVGMIPEGDRQCLMMFFFFQAEDGIRDLYVTGVQTCALPIYCDIAGRCGDCLGLADAGRESSVKGAERSVGASDGYGSKAQKSCGPTAGSARS